MTYMSCDDCGHLNEQEIFLSQMTIADLYEGLNCPECGNSDRKRFDYDPLPDYEK